MPRQVLLRRFVLVFSLIFYLFLAWSVPYSATDDWLWGMEEGLRWWLGGMLNGRYAGNFFAVVMCRFPAVKVLAMGLTMFLLPFLMALLAARGEARRFLPLFLACNAGILLMPPAMWQENYGWVSGFGNYVVSALFFLAWLLLLRRTADSRTHLVRRAVLLFFLSLACGLFVENLTALFLGASLILAVYALRDRALRPPFWACLAGSALAALLMFGNGMFSDLASTGSALNGLRELTFSLEDGPLEICSSILSWYVGRLLPIAFLRGIHMALPMAVITACAFWNSRLRPLCVLGLLPLGVNALIMTTEVYGTPGRIAASCAAWALPFLALLVQRDGWPVKIRRLLIYLAAPLSLLPLAVTPTLGQRLYFFPMVLLVLSAADAAAPLLVRRPCAAAAALLTAGLMLLWGTRSWVVFSCSQLREQLVQEAVSQGSDRLILPTDRYQRVVWSTRNPWNVEYADYYRRFYGVPDDVTLIFLPAGSFESWPDITPEQWEGRLEFAPSKDYVPSLP